MLDHADLQSDSARAAELCALITAAAGPLLERLPVPGLAVAVVVGDTRVTSHLGHSDAGTRRSITPETRFQIASSSKAVSTFGILRFATSLGIDLDAPIVPMLRSWPPSPDAFAGRDPASITLRSLLSHTSGLNVHSFPWIAPQAPTPTTAQLLAGVDGPDYRVFLQHPAGVPEYSGGGITLASLLVEERAGESFASYMRREVLTPLGMKHSTYLYADLDPAEVCTRHDTQGRPLPPMRRAAIAASNLHTTAEDLASFLAAMNDAPGLAPGRGVIPPDLVRDMVQPQPRQLARRQWGLGWYLGDVPAQTSYKAGGSMAGVWTWIEGFPAARTGVALTTNSDVGRDLTAPISAMIRREVLGFGVEPSH